MCKCQEGANVGGAQVVGLQSMTVQSFNPEDVELVPLGLDSAKVTLPYRLVIPRAVVSITGLSRIIHIESHDQEYPKALVIWMQSDSRYAGWFRPTPPPEPKLKARRTKKAQAEMEGATV